MRSNSLHYVSQIMVVIATILYTGCLRSSEYTLYLQDATVSGPISEPPVHITSNTNEYPLRITSRIAVNSSRDHAIIGQLGSGIQLDTILNSNNTVSFRQRTGVNNSTIGGKNLAWKIPDATFGVDVDYAISNHFAITFGATYSSVDAEGLLGYNVGLGLFSEKGSGAIRVDAGIRWQSMAYDAHTVVVAKQTEFFTSHTYESVSLFRDKGTSTSMNLYASLTINTARKEWFINGFVQVGVSKQSLAKFKPTIAEPVYLPWLFPFPLPQEDVVVHDTREEFSSTTLSTTPGLYYDIDPSTRLVAGVRIDWQTEIEGVSPNLVLSPLIQLEWGL